MHDEPKPWQTPSSGNFRTRGGERADEAGLDNQVKSWPTPNTMDTIQPERDLSEMEPKGHWGADMNTGKLSEAVVQPKNDPNWTTPTASDARSVGSVANQANGHQELLHHQVRKFDDNWPTPRAEERDQENSRDDYIALSLAVKQEKNWPTPTDDDANNATRDSGVYKSLTHDVQQWPTPAAGSPNCIRGTGQDPERRKEQGHQVMLQDAVTAHEVPRCEKCFFLGCPCAGPGVCECECHKTPNWATPRFEDSQCAGTRHSRDETNDTLYSQTRAWASPRERDHHPSHKEGYEGDFRTDLGSQVRDDAEQWTTPMAEDAKSSGGAASREEGRQTMLHIEAANWGMPRADEWKGTGPQGSKSQQYRLDKGYLDAQVEEAAPAPSVNPEKRSLNPAWEALLMNWPCVPYPREMLCSCVNGNRAPKSRIGTGPACCLARTRTGCSSRDGPPDRARISSRTSRHAPCRATGCATGPGG